MGKDREQEKGDGGQGAVGAYGIRPFDSGRTRHRKRPPVVNVVGVQTLAPDSVRQHYLR